MKFNFVILSVFLTTLALAKSPYILVCHSDLMTLSLQKKLQVKPSLNGWSIYWGKVDYVIKKSTNETKGTLRANISWRKDSRPGYNGLSIGLIEDSEAKMRDLGFESGSIGFGAIDSRENINGKFKANWELYRSPEQLKDFDIDSHPLNCEITP